MAKDSQAHPLRQILLAIRNRISEVLELDPQFVRIVSSDNYTVCADQRFVYIRPFGPKPVTDHGGGRRTRPIHRSIRVYLYTRNSLDQTGFDTVALTDDTNYSHFVGEDLLIDALDEYWPTLDEQTVLTIEPIHFESTSEGKPVRESENDVGFTRSHQDYEVVYLCYNSNPAP